MDIIKQAIEFHKKSDFQNAEKCYLQFIEQNPSEAKAHHLLGALYMQICDFKKAARSLETAFGLDRATPVQTDLALCYYELKEYRLAMLNLQDVLSVVQSKILYEKLLDSANKVELGEPYVKYALKYIELYGEDIEIMRNLAGYALDIGKFDIAERCNKRLIELYPDDYVAYNNLALTYEFQLNFPLAEEYYKKTIELKPNLDPIFNLSVLLRRMRRYDESLKMLELSRKYGLSDVGYDCTLGLLRLTLRDFSGYPLYLNFVKSHHSFPDETPWDGKPDKDMVLILRATEGYGDALMFSRYLDYIDATLFKDVLLVVPTPLLSLFAFNFPNFKVIDWKIKPAPNLTSAIVMDLPGILKLDFNHIPSADRFLMSPPEYSAKWSDYIDDKKFNVGLFYSGNFTNKRTLRNRNVPFEFLESFFNLDKEISFNTKDASILKNIRYYSLQPEKHFKQEVERQNEKTGNIESLAGKLENFSDTAAVIEKLDLVITIDSSVAHLAAALGKKTFILLPYSADWRWFEDVDTTVWYNCMKIFRQKEEGEWQEPVERLKEAFLNEVLNAKKMP